MVVLSIVMLFDGQEPPFFALAFIFGSISGIFLLGVLFELLRGGLFSKASRAIPKELLPIFEQKLIEMVLPTRIRFQANRIRIVSSDFSMGAHVRGVLRPKIYVSAGLFLGLIGGLSSAKAIIAHELAHIYNHDRWLPGIITFAFMSACGNIYFLFFGDMGSRPNAYTDGSYGEFNKIVLVANVIVIYVMCRYMLHRREYGGDAVGAMILGSHDEYKEFLQSLSQKALNDSPLEDVPFFIINRYVAAAQKDGDTSNISPELEYLLGHSTMRQTFTHPSLSQRLSALNSYLLLGPSKTLAGLWLLVLFGYLIIFSTTGDPGASVTYISMMFTALLGLTIEIMRFAIVKIGGRDGLSPQTCDPK